MRISRTVFLLLAIAGAVLTWYFNLQFLQANPGVFDIRVFIAGGLANPAAGSLSMDITIAAVTGFIWMIMESGRLGMRYGWLYVVLGCVVAFACAFPLFLFMREGRLAAMTRTE